MSINLSLKDIIEFQRPLTRVVKQNITIENPHDKPVAFKVKTTAPKLYCVRPNSDVIRPNSTIEVQIMLQAQREEPPLDIKCRDKFLILSTYIDQELEKMGITEMWNHVESNDKYKKNIHQHKLRCVYTESKDAEATTAPAAAPAAAAAAAPVTHHLTSITPVAATTAPTAPATAKATVSTNATDESHNNQENVIEKMKAMERELSKYKEAEKLELKAGFPPSIYILISLMIAAIAYFITTK